MAEDVIFNVEVNAGEAIDEIVKLRKENERLRAAMKDTNRDTDEGRKSYEAYEQQIKANNRVINSYTKEIQNEIRANDANSGSLEEMRARLSNMLKAYDALGKADREGAIGKDQLQNIQNLTEELKSAEEESGRFQRNVGNYKNAILDALGPIGKMAGAAEKMTGAANGAEPAFKAAGAQVGVFGKQLLSLLANPIVATVAAIASVVLKLADAFKKNDDAMTALQSLMASFKPVLDLVNKGFEAIVNVLTDVVNGVSSFVQSITNAIPFLRDYAKAEEDIVRAGDELEESQRQHALAQSERDVDVAKLRDKSIQREKYSYSQRKKFLEDAINLEKKTLSERRADAKEELRIAEQKYAMEMGYTSLTREAYSKLSDERKNEINSLRIAVNSAEKEFYDGTRRLQSQMNTFAEQERKEAEERAKKAEEAAKERSKIEAEEKAKAEDMVLAAMADGLEKQEALLKAQFLRQVEELKKRLATEKNLTDAARRAINEQIILTEANYVKTLGDIREQSNREQVAKSIKQWDDYWRKVEEAEKAGQEAANIAFENLMNSELAALEGNELAKSKVRERFAEQRVKMARFEYDSVAKAGSDAYESQEAYELALAMANQKKLAAEGEYQQALKATQAIEAKTAQKSIDDQYRVAGAIMQAANAMFAMTETLAGQNEKYGKFAKAMAMAQILTSTAISIAQAVQAAVQAGGFSGPAAPVTIPVFIAEIVGIVGGAVASAISTLKSANVPRFANGGIVHGPSHAGGGVRIEAEGGEFIVRKRAVNANTLPLLTAINGGGTYGGNRFAGGGLVVSDAFGKAFDSEQMKSAMREALEELHPQVDVREITRMQNRVAIKERISKK